MALLTSVEATAAKASKACEVSPRQRSIEARLKVSSYNPGKSGGSFARWRIDEGSLCTTRSGWTGGEPLP
jgi:hypothetical protein